MVSPFFEKLMVKAISCPMDKDLSVLIKAPAGHMF